MNNNITELVYIIDMSGSMSGKTQDTIGGYNAMLEKQRELNRENPQLKANVTTVFFDDRYIMIHDREDLDNVRDITANDYVPCGCTAMLDAIGKTVVSVGQKLAAMDEADRPGLVSVAIITDGLENASREYDWATVRSMIKEQKEKYSWLFTFIGANIDVDQTAMDLGVDLDLSATFTCVNTVYSAHAEGACCARAVMASTDGCVAMAATSYAKALESVT